MCFFSKVHKCTVVVYVKAWENFNQLTSSSCEPQLVSLNIFFTLLVVNYALFHA
jgi:hypothetical protein